MVDGIKGRRKIEKTKTSNLLIVDGIDEFVMERKESSFSGVVFGISRLEWVMQRI